MTGDKWRLIILAIVILSVAIVQWVSTTPTWYLYHKEYPMVRSVEAFDALMLEVREDVDQNFRYHYPIDSEAARIQIESYLSEPDPHIAGCFVDAWVWVWEGSDMQPNWAICREWRDTWRECDYTLPEVKEAQFCMMGFTRAPQIIG